jgi:hypothetical protein
MKITRLTYPRRQPKRQHYYDDIRRGIAFEYWPNGDEINTLIVHQPDVGVIVDAGGQSDQ